MSKNVITKNGLSLAVKEVEGKRVVTYSDVAKVHKTSITNLRSNFSNHKKHFIKGVDYFHIKGKGSVKNFDVAPNITQINVFTESGYLMLVKSLTDDLSWQVQRELVNGYFRKQVNTFQSVLPFLPWEVKQLVRYRVEHRLTQVETAKLLGISLGKVQETERRLKPMGYHAPQYAGYRHPEPTQLSLDMEV